MTNFTFALYLKWMDFINMFIRVFYELPRGIDFARSVWPYPADSHNVRYERTTRRQIERAVKHTLPRQARILDVGCGKGYFIYCLKKMGYTHVDGLEYDKKLLATARRNFDQLGLDGITLYRADAAEFTELDSYDAIYLFNPFQSVAMLAFMKQLEASLKRKPRDLIVLYMNPVERRLWSASLLFDRTETRTVQRFPHLMQADYYAHRADPFSGLERFVRVLKHNW